MVIQCTGRLRRGTGVLCIALASLVVLVPLTLRAQNEPPAESPSASPAAAATLSPEEAERMADAALATPDAADADDGADVAAPAEPPRVNLLDLFSKGGYLMYPITAMSVVVIMFGFERLLALRRGRVFPRRLARGLDELVQNGAELDPQRAYRLCIEHRSPASRVIGTALLKTGRPQLEMERAVAASAESEAARLYTNVRPLVLAVTITPLLGLLGTVWGMIQAFFVTASNPVGINRAESLSRGIYEALVTTFAGLAVAIPAAIMAHYFEGRIQSLFRDIDELAQRVMPQLARYEGKVHPDFRRQLERSQSQTAADARAASQPVPRTRPATATE